VQESVAGDSTRYRSFEDEDQRVEREVLVEVGAGTVDLDPSLPRTHAQTGREMTWRLDLRER